MTARADPAVPGTDGPPTRPPRWDFLDGARASMLLLGVPFHASEIYRRSGDWMLASPETSWAATLLGCAVHVFRMPAFFVLAGFFAAMTIARRGDARWIGERCVRLGVPLVASLLAFGWVEEAIVIASREGLGAGDALAAALAAGPRQWSHHRWFLVVLLLHCASAVALRALVPGSVLERAFDALARGPRATLRLVVALVALPFAIAGIGALGGADGLGIGLDGSEPHANFYFQHGVFFAIGYALYRIDGSMRRLVAFGPGEVALAAVSIALFALVHPSFRADGVPLPGGASGVAILLVRTGVDLVAGFFATKLFFAAAHRFMAAPSPLADRLVRVSLWVYLVHMVPVLGLGALLVPVALPPTLEIALIVVVATALSVATGELVRRSTPLRLAFEGRRPERS